MLFVIASALALPFYTSREDIGVLVEEGVLTRAGLILGVICFKVVLAAMVDLSTLHAMFLPSSDPVFCFGTLRSGGFRLGNLLVSEVLTYSLVHLAHAEEMLPPAVRMENGGPSCVLLAFLSFMYVITFFGVAADYKMRLPREETAVKGAEAGFRLAKAVQAVANTHEMSAETRAALQAVLTSHRGEVMSLLVPRADSSSPACCSRVSGRHVRVFLMCGYFVCWSMVLISFEEHLWRVVAAACMTLACALPLIDFGTDKGRRGSNDAAYTIFALGPTLAAALILHQTGNSSTGVACCTALTMCASILPMGSIKAAGRARKGGGSHVGFMEGCVALCPLIARFCDVPADESDACWSIPREYLQDDLYSSVKKLRRARESGDVGPLISAARLTVTGLAMTGELCSLVALTLKSFGLVPVTAEDILSQNALAAASFACGSAGLCMWVCYSQCRALNRSAELSPAAHEAALLATISSGCSGLLSGIGTCMLVAPDSPSQLYYDLWGEGVTHLVASACGAVLWRELWCYMHHHAVHSHEFFRDTFHSQHHQYRGVSAWSAGARHPVEAVTLSVGPQLLPFLVPVHPLVLLLVAMHAAYWLVEGAVDADWPRAPVSTFRAHHHADQSSNFGSATLLFDYCFGTLAAGGDPVALKEDPKSPSAVAAVAAGAEAALRGGVTSPVHMSPVHMSPVHMKADPLSSRRFCSEPSVAAARRAAFAAAAAAAGPPTRPLAEVVAQEEAEGLSRMEEVCSALPRQVRAKLPQPLQFVSCRIECDDRGRRVYFVLRTRLKQFQKQMLVKRFKSKWYPSQAAWIKLIDADADGDDDLGLRQQLVPPTALSQGTDFSALYSEL
eukprot:TRINITY_DN4521_c2_g1_i2.p1 TRINITY_DN4521_c2_g1~~TRINITY_DN4521_c2_g1_i2.p1  ORF type:complete len:846 (+),score=222.46 TRINITY_DN4521_c2_g1_i2:264-2801(+)